MQVKFAGCVKKNGARGLSKPMRFGEMRALEGRQTGCSGRLLLLPQVCAMDSLPPVRGQKCPPAAAGPW